MIRFLKKLIPETHPLRLLYHRLRSFLSAALAGFPARKLIVIGVTGTDGKTTTVAMISHILHSVGIRAGAVSTAFYEVDGVRSPNPTQKTSVSAAVLQSFLNRLLKNGCTHAVIEASSHGLLQGRLSGIRPDIAIITNTSAEHLDYHGTMVKYIEAKSLLFRALKPDGTKVLNSDDQSYPALKTIPSKQTVIFSPSSQITEIRADALSCQAKLKFGDRLLDLKLHIPGSFNLKNALSAVSAVSALDIDPAKAVSALGTFEGAGGRMERIDAGQDFGVYVDFTVTPASYEQTLIAARKIAGNNRILVLTGSCGDRMPEKRPQVGAICARLADIIAVTNEDPYSEDPEKIIDEVLGGIPSGFIKFIGQSSFKESRQTPDRYCIRISDRLEAMRFLFNQARRGDVVLLCGKGTDITMMTLYGQVPWNEREIAKTELKKLAGTAA